MKIFEVFKDLNFHIYQRERFNLDSLLYESFQDSGEEFERNRIFETDNKGGKFVRISEIIKTSNFQYFLDGSRLTLKY